MRFACEQCQTKYTIPDERVRGKILKIRCKNCNCQITISEGGVRTARPVESAAGGGDTIIPTKGMLAAAPEEGGDSTMIGGMADFFGGPGGMSATNGKGVPADEWYISVDGTTAGPMPLQELAQCVVGEEATPGRELFVWREGLGEWRPPAEVEDVKLAVQKERRVPAPKPVSAVKPALLPKPQLQAQPVRPGLNENSVGASLMDEHEGGDSEDATQIGSLSMPLAPPATKPERSDLALEAVDFDVVTDLPAPPKPQPKPAAAPPPKPKGPPAFKPPPFPGAGPGPKLPPKSLAPAEVAPSPPAGPSDVLSGGQLRSHHDDEAPGPAQSPARPDFNEDATGAVRGDALNAALQPKADAGPNDHQDGFPMGANQPPMDQMGGQYGDGSPAAMGGMEPAPEAELGAKAKKRSPLVLGGVAAALLGIITTVYVVTRPAKPVPPKQEIVDAGTTVDAQPSVSEQAAKVAKEKEAEKDKQDKAKKDDLLGITVAQRDALIEKNQKALTGCFGKALKKSSKLAGAIIQVEVTISGKGKTDTVELSNKGKDLDGKLDKCLQKSIKRWKFKKPSDKSAYQVKFTVPVDG